MKSTQLMLVTLLAIGCGDSKPSSATPAVPISRIGKPTAADHRMVGYVERYFATEDEAERRDIATAMQRDSAYDPARVGDWLHTAPLFPAHEPGRVGRKITWDDGEREQSSSVVFRFPRDYRADRPWPVIMPYHFAGGIGSNMVLILEELMGEAIEGYVIAAPSGFRPAGLVTRESASREHREMLRQIKKIVHVDSDRVYLTGFSRGGFATWSLASLYADQYAGACPNACVNDLPSDIPGLWELMAPNLRHVRILNVWGRRDPMRGRTMIPGTAGGNVNELNDRMTRLSDSLNLNIDPYTHPNGHTYEPPLEPFMQLMQARRIRYPRTVSHRFRFLHQAEAYWLEAFAWAGPLWPAGPLDRDPLPNESPQATVLRKIDQSLGRLHGTIDGQTITVEQDHVEHLAIWIGDDMIDWSHEVKVMVNGRVVHEGKITRDLGVCLSEAARTYDFDRLRWAVIHARDQGEPDASAAVTTGHHGRT